MADIIVDSVTGDPSYIMITPAFFSLSIHSIQNNQI